MQFKLFFQPALAFHMLGPICTINCELLSVASAVPGYERMGLNASNFKKKIHAKRNHIIEILLNLFQTGDKRSGKAQRSNMFKWWKLWNGFDSSWSSSHCQARRLAPKKCKEGIMCVGVMLPAAIDYARRGMWTGCLCETLLTCHFILVCTRCIHSNSV